MTLLECARAGRRKNRPRPPSPARRDRVQVAGSCAARIIPFGRSGRHDRIGRFQGWRWPCKGGTLRGFRRRGDSGPRCKMAYHLQVVASDHRIASMSSREASDRGAAGPDLASTRPVGSVPGWPSQAEPGARLGDSRAGRNRGEVRAGSQGDPAARWPGVREDVRDCTSDRCPPATLRSDGRGSDATTGLTEAATGRPGPRPRSIAQEHPRT